MDNRLCDMIIRIKKLMEVQGRPGTIDQGDYMVGLYNGMEICLRIMEERPPNFKHCDVKSTIRKGLTYEDDS